ncbi:MAG: hypothetical protein Q4E75_07140, partial [bacterium]|nr:hypothetical protein [bacterium]
NRIGNTTIYGNSKIIAKSSGVFTNTGTITITATQDSNSLSNSIGPEIIAQNTGIYVDGGILNIGIDEATSSVNTSIPSITGTSYGVNIASGTCNFYDGIIKGKTSAINGATPNTPNGYTISPETTDAEGYKTVTLVSE